MDQDLFFGGQRFISANRAAQRSGYTADYIGQLCRQGKATSRMVGRTWYVEFDSLIKYKENNLAKNKNLKGKAIDRDLIAFEKQQVVARAKSSSFLPKFKYASESLPLVPKISKEILVQKEIKQYIKPRHTSLFVPTAVAVAVFTFGTMAFSWLNYLSPRYAEIAQAQILSISEKTVLALNTLKSRFNLAFIAQVSQPPVSIPTAESDGLVIFPGTVDGNAVASVKSAFSDEVEVFFDESGESGVIRPVFSTPGDSTDYSFVMVPIKKQQ